MRDKQVMLITGSSRGIGRYLAEYYANKGFNVTGCSRKPVDFNHENYQHFCLDICDEKKVKTMFREILQKHNKLDILVNNAAVNLSSVPILLANYDSALETIKINLLGTFLISREAAKLMVKNSFGRIINFSSMASKHNVKGEAIYTASKAAIESFTKVMAKEVFPNGITCNVVAPSAINTELMQAVDKDTLQEVLKLNAIPYAGKMGDVSNVINWLIKPESDSITGQVIFLGGV